MLFKLSVKNMKKSFSDYAIYFLTIVLGVAIFYMFNSLDSQQAMLEVSNSKNAIITLMIDVFGYVSIFVAVVLGLLIVYANNFLINRRKKEFGIYMTLGMGRRQISKIILLETVFVGIISLVVGLVIGIFASQFMSIFVAKMFEANMRNFEFVFSKDAFIKTCICFAVMYIAVMVFNTFTVSKYKLINLLNASKKNEKVKIKKPVVSVVVFIIASVMLSWAYFKVTKDINSLETIAQTLCPIFVGIVGTVLVFWSLSGFVLEVVQSIKSVYLKGTNMFVLRQINSKVNTTVISMSVICLMLFMTITLLSSALSLKNTMQKEVREVTPVDINLYKLANLPESFVAQSGKTVAYTNEQRKDSQITVQETLENNGFDMSLLKDVVEIPIYETNEWLWKDSLGDKIQIPAKSDTPEDIIKVSDYNKVARLYGLEEYELENDEYMVVCNSESTTYIRNLAFQYVNTKVMDGIEYHLKYNECKNGFVFISNTYSNSGIILVSDSFKLKEEWKAKSLLVANYNAQTDNVKEYIEEICYGDTGMVQKLADKGIDMSCYTRISLIDSSVGLATIITFIAIYLGIICLIASAAILALKQLTESSDNVQRYTILRKIGCDENMINKALFSQIGIFFALPLGLAIIHSVFGIKFAMIVMSGLASSKELLPSIVATVVIIGVIYGAYFLATYFGSKNIIKAEE